MGRFRKTGTWNITELGVSLSFFPCSFHHLALHSHGNTWQIGVTKAPTSWIENRKGTPYCVEKYQGDSRERRVQESNHIKWFMNSWAHL